ncbi:MAG: hypothetical protein U0Q11_22335 [Vicinamibacterales bacterium]
MLIIGSFNPAAFAQPRDRDDRWDRFRNGRYDATTRPSVVDAGTYMSVRTRQNIRASRAEDRIYTAVVDQDVWDDDRRLAVPIIPRGTPVELRVRSERDGDLILDLNAIVVQGRRYLVDSGAVRTEARARDSHAGEIVGAGAIVGTIVGAIAGGGKGAAVGAVTGAAAGGVGVMARGRSLDVPSGAVITFRLDRDLVVAGQRRR